MAVTKAWSYTMHLYRLDEHAAKNPGWLLMTAVARMPADDRSF